MCVLTFYDNFRRRIGSLLGGGFTDAILLVEEVEIPVHKCILAAHSEYFSHLFATKNGSRPTADQRDAASGSQVDVEAREIPNSNNQSLVEINEFTVPLPDTVFELKNIKVEVVRAVLDYFYRGEYNYDENMETHWLVLEFAHQFRLRDLEEILLINLVKSITVENFPQFYNMKMYYKNDQLKESCFSFLKTNGEEIAKSDNFSKLNLVSLLCLLDEESFAAAEIDIFRAVERWASVNKPNTKTVKDIVKKIRLATMSQADLFNVVKCSKELPSIDILEAIQNPVAELNVAQSSLGAEVLSGNIKVSDLISGSGGCTSHKVGGKPDCIVVKSYKYYVEVSIDEKKWIRVVDHSNYRCSSLQFLRFDPRAVRYIKMTGTDEDLTIVSLEAKYTNVECSLDQGIQVASSNVILESKGASVTGGYCGTYSNGSSFKPINCINGKEDSSAPVKEDSPLIIKLGQPYWLSSLRVKLNAKGHSYTIESSPDGESWQPVGSETYEKDDNVWRTFEFSRRIVLYFKVTMKRINLHCININLFHLESPASTTAVTN